MVLNGNTSESYTYDAVGNRLSSLGVSPYAYNSSNQLTSTPNATFTYDNNGNTTSETDAQGTTTYAWDYENRLVSITLPGSGGTVNFSYDPFGRRIQKVSTATTVFVYDVANILEEVDGTGAVLARYTQGLGIDEPLAMLRSGATSYYDADGLGSVTSLTDGSGAFAATYTYDAFGNLISSAGSVVNPFRYTARELDSETSLYYYRARYYDAGAGRFESEDPERFSSGSNFYPYAENQPTNLTDPLGLFTPERHYSMTYKFASLIFGPNCLDKAREVAEADRAMDDTHGLWEKLRLLTKRGEGWDKPGPHFPSNAMVHTQLSLAVKNCSLKALGQALHSAQDAFAHEGLSPAAHFRQPWWDKKIDWGHQYFRRQPRIMKAEDVTAEWLGKFQVKCLGCCR